MVSNHIVQMVEYKLRDSNIGAKTSVWLRCNVRRIKCYEWSGSNKIDHFIDPLIYFGWSRKQALF